MHYLLVEGHALLTLVAHMLCTYLLKDMHYLLAAHMVAHVVYLLVKGHALLTCCTHGCTHALLVEGHAILTC
jgi:hypothetical protein